MQGAKLDTSGQFITSPNETEMWEILLEACKSNKSQPWKMADLDKVLKNLKTNKTRDQIGLINEIFKPGCMVVGGKRQY